MRVVHNQLVLSQRERRAVDRAREILCEAFNRLEERLAVNGAVNSAYHEACDLYPELETARFQLNCFDASEPFEWPEPLTPTKEDA